MYQLLALLLFCLVAALSAEAQPDNCKDCITWQADRPLTWADFKGRPAASSPNKAMTDSGLSIAFSCDGKVSEVVIGCYFTPGKSWTKVTDNDRLLAHEQLHFDITELFARKLRSRLSALGTDCERVNKEIGRLYDHNYDDYMKYQQRYDKETRHSIEEAEQKRWEKKVADELRQLEEFSSK